MILSIALCKILRDIDFARRIGLKDGKTLLFYNVNVVTLSIGRAIFCGKVFHFSGKCDIITNKHITFLR